MSQRIGEALVQRGLISAEQLGTALQVQHALGGSLGANLLELGLITERNLGQTLAELLRARYASPEFLNDLRGPVLKALPRPLIEKHQAVPIKLDRNTLHLLVANLTNLSGLSRSTGFRIIPWVAPEVRVFHELQRHFGIQMIPRYSEIAGRLESGKTDDTESTQPGPYVSVGLDTMELETGAAEEASEPGEVKALAEQLCGVDGDDEAVGIMLDQAIQWMANCVMFRVSDNTARIWDARSSFVDRHVRSSVAIPVASGSLLELLAVHPYFNGPTPTENSYQLFFTQLGLPVPYQIMLLPIKVGSRLVAIFYGDGGVTGEIKGTLEDQLQLARKLALALTLVLIKDKIRA
jgi:hypothetical protein